MTLWVTDASPLIFLAKLGRLDVLHRSAERLYLPCAVLNEIRAKPDEATRDIEIAVCSWLSVHEVANRPAVELLLANLDLGEAEVIVLAKELNADWVLLDDLDARRFARRAGLRPIGTLGLLLAARLRGEIPSLRAEVDGLRRAGFRVSAALVEAALKEAGEAI